MLEKHSKYREMGPKLAKLRLINHKIAINSIFMSTIYSLNCFHNHRIDIHILNTLYDIEVKRSFLYQNWTNFYGTS